ncbi:diguanylate cyclase domain-containing protein [Actinoplanes sp. URMC 104]|uniref:diguanylate cyclase domain-containing protein n=1 Tax=Actinoplanes sp. URMC 104 TaxID=3423409 RepID=UPI003F1DA353
MVGHALHARYITLRSFVKGDLMRALRLFFLVSLLICSVGLTAEISRMGHGVAAIVLCAGVQLLVISLRVVEFRRARPGPVWVDVIELSAVLVLMSQVTEIAPMISTMFMSVLFRAAIGRLPRLIGSQVGYLGVWAIAIAMPWHVEPVLGAMISLPTTTFMVFGTRTLMAKLQEQQNAQNTLLEGVLTELPTPVVVVDSAGDVVMANSAVMELIGWSQPGEANLRDLQLQDLEQRPVNLHDVVADSGASASRVKIEVRLVRTDGTVLQVVVQTVPMAQGFTQGRGVVLALVDVTAQRSYEERLHKAAYFDMLTGLPNRRMLFERLNVTHSDGTPYSVLLIDLNDFKVVNDTLGHKIGDELLAGIAQRILSAVDNTATVARLGGDEFAVLLPHAAPADAEAAAQAVRESFAEPLQLSCGSLHGKGTVGLAVAEPGDTPDQVIERADHAMYQAKAHSKQRTRSPQCPRSNPVGA